MKILLFGVWLTFGADAATTTYALNHGGREVLIPSQNAVVIDSVVAGEAFLTMRGLQKFESRHPLVAKVIGVSIIAARSAIVYHNLNQLRKQ